MSAQVGSAFFVLVSLSFGLGAFLLACAFVIGIFGSVFDGGSDSAGVASWCLGTLLSLTLYLSGPQRHWFAIVVSIILPITFLWLVVMKPELGGLIVFGTLILHICVVMSIATLHHASLLKSRKFWFDKQLGEGRCPRCLYDIRNLPLPRCPECGFDFGEVPAE